MGEIFFSSDWHLDHNRILSFTKDDGSFVRPGFANVDEMNEFIVERHNSVVKPSDKFYCLGDVGFGDSNKVDRLLSRMNGVKRLIIGNHDDITKQSYLLKHFKKIKLWWPFEEFIFSHIPLREESMRTRSKKEPVNVHGHIHHNKSPTPRHINVSMEAINYTPVNIDDIRKMLK